MASASHRSLPEDTGAASLTARERAAIAGAWARRARNELSTSAVFADLTRSLIAIGAPSAVIRQAAAAVEDEVRHAEICAHVARAYDAAGAQVPPSVVAAHPRFDGGDELDALLFVVMQSCVNEGVATAYLQRCLDEATSPLARAAVRDILVDEIHHARIGWMSLASPSAERFRADVAEAAPTLLRLIADGWLAPEPEGSGPFPVGHGVLAPAAIAHVVRDAYDALIVPGLERVGVDAQPARAWLRARTWPTCRGTGRFTAASAGASVRCLVSRTSA